MKSLLFFLSFLSSVFAYATDLKPRPNVTDSIYKGTPGDIRNLKNKKVETFLASQVLILGSKETGFTRCSGTLIKETPSSSDTESTLVLTAAHCIVPDQISELKIFNLPISSNSAEVKEVWTDIVISAAKQQRREVDLKTIAFHDLALIRLKEPLSGKTLEIKALSEEVFSNINNVEKFYIAGFGRVPDLEGENKPIIENGIPTGADVFWSPLSKDHMLNLTLQDESAVIVVDSIKQDEVLAKVCAGDSGGPLIYIDDNKAYVAGVASKVENLRVHSCGTNSHYAVVKKDAEAIKKLPRIFHKIIAED